MNNNNLNFPSPVEAATEYSNLPPASPNPSGKKTKIIIIAILVLLAGTIGVAAYFIFRSSGNSPSSPVAIKRTPASLNDSTILLYSQEIGNEEHNGRIWPTVQIMRKMGNTEPEILAEVGAIGEYPIEFQLSPDKTLLAINLESKVQILDLNTKELKDVMIPNEQVDSVLFSPDSKQLLIWDQSFNTDTATDYYIHQYNLANQTDAIIKQGTTGDLMTLSAWRKDNKVIISQEMGDYTTSWFFDLTNKQLSPTPGEHPVDGISRYGQVILTATDDIEDICNDYAGSSTKSYSIIDPISGNQIGMIDGDKEKVELLAFSRDDQEILYRTEALQVNEAYCQDIGQRTYFTMDTGKGKVTKFAALNDALSTWDGDYVGASLNYNTDQSGIMSIMVNDEPVVSGSNLNIIGQFFR